MPDTTAPVPLLFGGVLPVLRVRDAAKSRDYYVNTLGFKVNFEAEDFVSVSRGGCNLFLCQGDQGNPGSWVWIDGKDVDALYEEYKASGARIRHPPRTTRGRWKCKSRISMATSCLSAPTLAPANPTASGWTCTAAAGSTASG